jgi:hypothetical protein
MAPPPEDLGTRPRRGETTAEPDAYIITGKMRNNKNKWVENKKAAGRL